MTIHVSIIFVICIAVAWYWIGYFAHWFLTKRAGIIHIQKSNDKNDYDKIAIEFINPLDDLYSQKEVLFKVHVQNRIENSPDNDNT